MGMSFQELSKQLGVSVKDISRVKQEIVRRRTKVTSEELSYIIKICEDRKKVKK